MTGVQTCALPIWLILCCLLVSVRCLLKLLANPSRGGVARPNTGGGENKTHLLLQRALRQHVRARGTHAVRDPSTSAISRWRRLSFLRSFLRSEDVPEALPTQAEHHVVSAPARLFTARGIR